MNLITLVNDRQYTIGAEIGVWRGAHAFRLLERCPQVTRLYLVDPWQWRYCHFAVPAGTVLPERMAPGWYHATMGEPVHGQADLESLARAVQIRAVVTYRGRVVVLRQTSRAARHHIARGSLDFVYVDAIHLYEHVLDDLVGWWDHLRAGGIMSGDDYSGPSGEFPGVAQAVDAFAAARGRAVQVEAGGFYWIVKAKGLYD